MKQKLLALVAVASLAGINTVYAVNANPYGAGEVLIYPYYTVEGGQDTYISVVNTTNHTKAIKVRFFEAMNSQEVLNFNVYLSSHDHWSAVIVGTESGASIRTTDTSCTVPRSLAADTPGLAGPTVAFRNFKYKSDSINNGTDRTREGYVEIIEMGVFDVAGGANAEAGAFVKDIEHNGRGALPSNCQDLTSAWQTGGEFDTGVAALGEPAGGLYGYGVLIDVAEGTNATYDAFALQFFSDKAIHTDPGSSSPSLADTSPASAVVFDDSSSAPTVLTFASGIDAASAAMMVSSISNDFVLERAINAETSWIVTLPTKREYVNGVGAPKNPFTEAWNMADTSACELVPTTYYNRESRGVEHRGFDFPLRPPSTLLSLCYGANVINFSNSDVVEASDRISRKWDAIFESGWMKMDFTNTPANNLLVPETGATRITGLPVVGFAVQKYVNGSVGGVLSNYAGTVTHKGTVTITP